jgi:hypothetical protein
MLDRRMHMASCSAVDFRVNVREKDALSPAVAGALPNGVKANEVAIRIAEVDRFEKLSR